MDAVFIFRSVHEGGQSKHLTLELRISVVKYIDWLDDIASDMFKYLRDCVVCKVNIKLFLHQILHSRNKSTIKFPNIVVYTSNT